MQRYESQPLGMIARARQLRRDAPAPEQRLRRALRESSLLRKWRRHVPVGPYLADILCFSERLFIEVDADTHATSKRYDEARTTAIAHEGLRLIRFANGGVMNYFGGVIAAVTTQFNIGKGSVA